MQIVVFLPTMLQQGNGGEGTAAMADKRKMFCLRGANSATQRCVTGTVSLTVVIYIQLVEAGRGCFEMQL